MIGSTAEREPLDKQWYKRFEAIAAFQAYEYFDGDKTHRDEEKQKFLAGESPNPSLDYPKLDSKDLDEKVKKLLELKSDIIRDEPNVEVRWTYRWRINEKIAEVRLMQAAANGDMKRFKKFSEFVYGQPDAEFFLYALQSIRGLASREMESSDPLIASIANTLNDQLPLSPQGASQYRFPTQEKVEHAGLETREMFSTILSTESNKDSFTAEEIKPIFESALQSLRADGWTVLVDTSSKSAISVSQESKTVRIPADRELTLDNLRALIVHEIGTHVARRANGERSKLLLLGLGLDRYEQGEEGVAMFREQAFGIDADDFTALENYLAIGLAYGIDGKGRDFRQIYEIMQSFYHLKNLKDNMSPEKALTDSIDKAWNRTVRTFRGTNCSTPGICFTKDIIYTKGNIEVWELMRHNPEEMVLFNVGKYDPTSPKHLYILEQLGITDEDISDHPAIRS